MTSLELHLHTRFDLGYSSSRTGSGIFSFDPFTFYFLVRGGISNRVLSYVTSFVETQEIKFAFRESRQRFGDHY